jgi:hypothetical protein
VPQLAAQSVDLDVQAREGTLGPIAWPQCFDHERGRRPHSEPENQQRQKGSLRAPLHPAGDTIVEDLHAPHHAHKHPVRVVVAPKTGEDRDEPHECRRVIGRFEPLNARSRLRADVDRSNVAYLSGLLIEAAVPARPRISSEANWVA